VNPKEVLEFAKKNDAKQLDLRFTRHSGFCSITFPTRWPRLTKASSKRASAWMDRAIRGWAAIHESDMLLIPDPDTAIMDPFAETPTLVMLGDVEGTRSQAALRARPAALDRPEGPSCT